MLWFFFVAQSKAQNPNNPWKIIDRGRKQSLYKKKTYLTNNIIDCVAWVHQCFGVPHSRFRFQLAFLRYFPWLLLDSSRLTCLNLHSLKRQRAAAATGEMDSVHSLHSSLRYRDRSRSHSRFRSRYHVRNCVCVCVWGELVNRRGYLVAAPSLAFNSANWI